MSTTSGINLDQIIAESQRAALPLTIAGVVYDLPGELPLDVLAPLLADNLNLSAVLADVMRQVNAAGTSTVTVTDLIVDTLLDHPALPLNLVKALGEVLERLLGSEAYAAFWALRPTAVLIGALARQLATHYGVTLLDFFGSDGSSESDGEQSKPTSPGSTDSTPAASGGAPVTPVAS